MLLRQMVLIRRFEEKCAELYRADKIHGFVHLYIGEEAIAVGTIPALEPDDAIVATYREHGHALVRGVPATTVMAEMYGKQEGCSHGRGGSMHLFDAATRFYGGNAIVGGGLPLAVGLALADKMAGRPRVTACFLRRRRGGRGGVPRMPQSVRVVEAAGAVLLREQPLCDGHRAQTLRVGNRSVLSKRRVTKSPPGRWTGWTCTACEDAARRALAAVRGGGGPLFLEFRTYRFRAHSMFDPQLYREKQEVEEWKKRDPILIYGARLREAGLLDDAVLKAIEDDVAAEVDKSVEFAEAGTWEPVDRCDPICLFRKDAQHERARARRKPSASPIARRCARRCATR